jgi:hypothetical protein
LKVCALTIVVQGSDRTEDGARGINQVYPPEPHPGTVNEPANWFREESSRKATDLEAATAGLFSKGKVKVYRCTLLDKDCKYHPDTGAGDCRQCNFALAYLMANPEHIKGIAASPK